MGTEHIQAWGDLNALLQEGTHSVLPIQRPLAHQKLINSSLILKPIIVNINTDQQSICLNAKPHLTNKLPLLTTAQHH